MWNKLKVAYRQFASDEPGKRFLRMHERWAKKAHPALKVLIVMFGAVLIVAGFLLGFIPGVPGIILALFGLALIAICFRKVADWMDWVEVKYRHLKLRWNRRRTDPARGHPRQTVSEDPFRPPTGRALPESRPHG